MVTGLIVQELVNEKEKHSTYMYNVGLDFKNGHVHYKTKVTFWTSGVWSGSKMFAKALQS